MVGVVSNHLAHDRMGLNSVLLVQGPLKLIEVYVKLGMYSTERHKLTDLSTEKQISSLFFVHCHLLS